MPQVITVEFLLVHLSLAVASYVRNCLFVSKGVAMYEPIILQVCYAMNYHHDTWDTYRRSGCDCEMRVPLQLKESRLKECAMTITRNHAPSALQVIQHYCIVARTA